MGIESSISCDYPGCGSVRREVNNWLVVYKDAGIHIYHWDDCPPKAMKDGKHFCGIAHTIQTVSNLLTPDTTKTERESTLELKPPLTREGTAPESAKDLESVISEVEESLSDRIDSLETKPGEPEKTEQ